MSHRLKKSFNYYLMDHSLVQTFVLLDYTLFRGDLTFINFSPILVLTSLPFSKYIIRTPPDVTNDYG